MRGPSEGATYRPSTTQRGRSDDHRPPLPLSQAPAASRALAPWLVASTRPGAARAPITGGRPTRSRSTTKPGAAPGAVRLWRCAGCAAVSGSVSARPKRGLGACRRFGIGGLVGRCARGAPCELCGLGMTLGQSSGRVGCDFCGLVADVQLVNAVKSALKLATAGARQSLP